MFIYLITVITDFMTFFYEFSYINPYNRTAKKS